MEKTPSKIRREIVKHDLPSKRKKISVDFEAVTNTSRVLSAEVRTSNPIIVNEVSSRGGDVTCGVSRNSPVQVSALRCRQNSRNANYSYRNSELKKLKCYKVTD